MADHAANDPAIRAALEQSLAWWREGGDERLWAENRRLKAEPAQAQPLLEIGTEIYNALQDQKKAREQAEAVEQAAREAEFISKQEDRDKIAQLAKELTQIREAVLVNESVTNAWIDQLRTQVDRLSSWMTWITDRL